MKVIVEYAINNSDCGGAIMIDAKDEKDVKRQMDTRLAGWDYRITSVEKYVPKKEDTDLER